MAHLINSSYFEKGDLYIPNNTDINVGEVGLTNQTNLDFYIVEYERKLLINALGIVLYTELQAALQNLNQADQKWIDLVEGKIPCKLQ